MRIDLHTHSTASDGTTSPAEVVARAAELGLDVIALTDHDTQAGVPEAIATAQALDVEVVPGAELSCTWDGIRLHLLAYLFDADDADLATAMSQVRDDRVPRLKRMTERLQADGIDVTWERVALRAGDASVGRPHLADTLVDAGVVADRDAAFRELLHQGSPYYEPHQALDVLEAIRLVSAAGGVTVFAHPLARTRGRTVPDSAIEQMAAAGLHGLEVDHRDHTPEDRQHLRSLAEDLGLATTGSSDYHGTGKKDNELGENLTDPEQWDALRAAVRR